MFKSLNFKVILFGFIFTFFSSFGQSFFLGLFNSSIRDALSISHGQFGSIYASATLLSSFILVWVGKKIDDFNIDDILAFYKSRTNKQITKQKNFNINTGLKKNSYKQLLA